LLAGDLAATVLCTGRDSLDRIIAATRQKPQLQPARRDRILDHTDTCERPKQTTRIAPFGRAPFAFKPLRDIRPSEVKEWYDALPYGRTAEKLLMIVRAIFAHARARGWTEADPCATVERQQVRYSGDYDFYSGEEIAALTGPP
jgi:hypothetical protein